jgi:hypothetical protein
MAWLAECKKETILTTNIIYKKVAQRKLSIEVVEVVHFGYRDLKREVGMSGHSLF